MSRCVTAEMLKQALHSYLSVSSLIVKLWNMTQGLVVAININNLPTFHSSVIRHRLFLVTFCRLIQSFRQFKMGNEFWFEQPLHNSRKRKRQGTVSMRGHCSQRWLQLMSSNVSCKKTSRHSSIYQTTNTSNVARTDGTMCLSIQLAQKTVILRMFIWPC